ncbi:phosphoenolpyruvate carboxykinase (ATP) [Spirosoma montaniterrae]|uniref:Phosphoenolpyruvate carboxykinase (ATP) n=1 Tax=Spirosoma montaniterrae TaxID=1178516 RepID=A0A1P9WTP2_9BACT|nr:phosphoenolpyruvate carboxykinase (ATP) [Spirosoma montaniterrae]AQG78710.1 phosphoenolpyruvate carboxykinase [Spirosoma montaniterrae]
MEATFAPQSIVRKSVQTPIPGWVHRNLSPDNLVKEILANGEGVLADNGAVVCQTGKFTGRTPKDRYIVRDELTDSTVDWGDVNQPFDSDAFDSLHERMLAHLVDRKVYVRDALAGALPAYGLRLRVVTTLAWHNLFSYNMFLRPEAGERVDGPADFTIICDPDFQARPGLARPIQAGPVADGTRNANFTILNLSKGIILIGGTGYAGEIKKAVFSALNFILPTQFDILPMHCAANVGTADRNGERDTALFFGLSGTGKTTLSADPMRQLIGDDEHGWADEGESTPGESTPGESTLGVFNFEGGCYAKVINLSRENEPQIFDAIRPGAILENTRFLPDTNTVNYADGSVTENTRCSYPLSHVRNAVTPSIGAAPKHIFFLSADAFGVLPPIAKLTPQQALDFFLLGYTAKIAGTEQGVSSPTATFSPCFGAAFLPLPARRYASLLKERIEQHGTQVWLINTGWKGGGFGIGKRMALPHTRAMIQAALTGALDTVPFQQHAEFGLAIPKRCPGVPTELLNPIDTWEYKGMYTAAAKRLANAFAEKLKEI